MLMLSFSIIYFAASMIFRLPLSLLLSDAIIMMFIIFISTFSLLLIFSPLFFFHYFLSLYADIFDATLSIRFFDDAADAILIMLIIFIDYLH